MSDASRSSPGDGEALVRRSSSAGSMTPSSVDASLSGTRWLPPGLDQE